MGVELGTSGVTSPGTAAYFGEAAIDYSKRLVEKNQDIIYHNLEIHGYMDLTLSQSEGRIDFVGVSTVLSPDYTASVVKSMPLVKSDNSVKFG